MKKLLGILLILIISTGLFADDDGFSSFDNGFSSDSEDGFSSDSDDGFGGDFGDSGNASVDFTGELNGSILFYPDYDDLSTSISEYATSLNMNLSYAGSNSDVIVSLHADEHLTDEEIKLHDVIDEAYVRWYAGPVDIELGLIKNIWGKGDEIHVVDVLNPSDNRSFMAGSYMDRKLAVPMLNTAFKGGDFGTLELTYIPFYTPAAQAMTGRWRQLQSYELEAVIEDQLNAYAQAQIATIATQWIIDNAVDRFAPTTIEAELAQSIATNSVLLQMAEIQNNVQQYEQTMTLEYGQFGARYSLYAGGFDLGVMYYYGFFDEPAIDKSQLATQNQVFINYDRMQMFGLDGAGVLGPLNLRAETAFYLSEDMEGDDPLVHNNRVAYLFGFDFKPGISSLDVNIQATGAITLNTTDLSAADIEYDEDDSYQTHLLSASIADKYLNEKLEIRVTGAWLVSTEDYLLQPEVTYNPDDNLSMGIRYSSYNGPDDGIFGQFKENSSLELSASYSF